MAKSQKTAAGQLPGCLGVSFCQRRGNYKARIFFAGSERFIGRYNTAVEAGLAYDQAARFINSRLDQQAASRVKGSRRKRLRPLNYPAVVDDSPAVERRMQAIFRRANVPLAAGDDSADGEDSSPAPESDPDPEPDAGAGAAMASAAAADLAGKGPLLATAASGSACTSADTALAGGTPAATAAGAGSAGDVEAGWDPALLQLRQQWQQPAEPVAFEPTFLENSEDWEDALLIAFGQELEAVLGPGDDSSRQPAPALNSDSLLAPGSSNGLAAGSFSTGLQLAAGGSYGAPVGSSGCGMQGLPVCMGNNSSNSSSNTSSSVFSQLPRLAPAAAAAAVTAAPAAAAVLSAQQFEWQPLWTPPPMNSNLLGTQAPMLPATAEGFWSAQQLQQPQLQLQQQVGVFAMLLPMTVSTSAAPAAPAAPTSSAMSVAAGQLQAAGGMLSPATATASAGSMDIPAPAPAAAAGVRAGAPAAGLLLGIQTPQQAYAFCQVALESVADLSQHLQQQQQQQGSGSSSTTLGLFTSWLEVACCLESAGRGAFEAAAGPMHAAAAVSCGPNRLALQLLHQVLLLSGKVLLSSPRGGDAAVQRCFIGHVLHVLVQGLRATLQTLLAGSQHTSSGGDGRTVVKQVLWSSVVSRLGCAAPGSLAAAAARTVLNLVEAL